MVLAGPRLSCWVALVGIGDQTILVDDDVLKTIHDALITFMFDD